MAFEGLQLGGLQALLRQSGARWSAQITSLSILSPNEKKKRLGFTPPSDKPSLREREGFGRTKREAEIALRAVKTYPSSHDLRNVNGQSFITPIKDQLDCGSCVAFGTLATIEGMSRVQRNDPDLQVDLSEAQLFYCFAEPQGATCLSGWDIDPAFDACKNTGITDESCFPYTPGDQVCELCTDWQDRVIQITSWHKIDNTDDMKTWISTHGPITVGFSVYDDFFFYNNGIYTHVAGGLLGGHCVSIVGFSDFDGCWICKNSWGPNWGENGFFRMAYGECGIDSEAWAADGILEGMPPEREPSEGGIKMNGKLVFLNFAANDPQEAQALYATLMGAPFARSLWDQGVSYHGPFSADGTMIIVSQRHHPQETVTPYFAVDDLNAALTELKNRGATVVWGPGDLPISSHTFGDYQALYKRVYPQSSAPPTRNMGQAALIIDAEGNAVGLVQLAEHTHTFFKIGTHRTATAQENLIHLEALEIGQRQK